MASNLPGKGELGMKINLGIPKDPEGKLKYLAQLGATEVYAHGIMINRHFYIRAQVEAMLAVMESIDMGEIQCKGIKE